MQDVVCMEVLGGTEDLPQVVSDLHLRVRCSGGRKGIENLGVLSVCPKMPFYTHYHPPLGV